MIVMLLSVVWGRIQERTQNFGHLVHETWPRTCMRSVFKFYKKQTKSKNHETYWDVVISYMEVMIKILDAYKPGHLHMWYQISHVEMFWFVSIVRDNVHEIFWNFYHSLHIWYPDISTSFMIFGLHLLFIEFKNTSHTISRTCFVNKMSEISSPFLDTASHNAH